MPTPLVSHCMLWDGATVRGYGAEDSRRAGTMAIGEKHGGAKLTADKVREIRTSKLSSYQMAEKIGVAASTIRSLRNGNGNWKWLSP